LLAGSLGHRLPLDPTEVLGFLTGAIAVWLTVKQNVWNWPVGIANSVFYLILFFQARLFADASLQSVYIVLGFLGWYWWVYAGQGRTELPVSRTTPRLILALLLIIACSTIAMTMFLVRVQDAAPFWDALTTVMSLIAQFMLTRKLLENWLVWMAADVIYIGLYLSRGLVLTSVLYGVYLAMCIAGFVEWRISLRGRSDRVMSVPVEAAVV
jgi:nicotinamide mononucleotide transporter